MSAKVPPRLAAVVALRAGGRCEYCRAPQVLIGQAFHIDHLVPRAAGGETTLANLCFACSHCNIAKGTATTYVEPRSRRRERLFNPRQDRWDEHFRWSRDWLKVMGRTAIGRATVIALNMNAPLLREARPFWRAAGLLP